MNKCPTCDNDVKNKHDENAEYVFPFCSKRCKLADLDNWTSGKYAIPAVETDEDSDTVGIVKNTDNVVLN